MKNHMEITLNGKRVTLISPPGRRLSEVLREELGLTGTKVGCNAGDCGACTVLIDGEPVNSCLTPVLQAAGRRVTTVEGLSSEGLSPLQESMARHGAAQCGICTPGMLMAATALLQKKPHPDPSEVADALGGVLCRCTGYQKIIDAVVEAGNPKKQPATPLAGNAVGARLERLDGEAKIAGNDIFGADHWPPGALLVRAIRSPHHRATFDFGDVRAWQAENSGVEAVLTAAHIPGVNRFGVIPPFADQPALADKEVLFRGEAVALVVGEAKAVATLDLDGFPVNWTPTSPYLEMAAATEQGASLLHGERARNILIEGLVETGDAVAALDGSAHVVERDMETRYVEHAYIEPEAGCAWLDGDTLVIQACTQAPIMDRDDTAKILDLTPEKVRIIPSATGGGFGSKLDVSLQPLIGLATLVTGKPCRMVYSRSESMASTTKRHPATMSARIGIDDQGLITGMIFQGDFNTGAYASWGPTVANRVPVHASGPYNTPNYKATTRAIHTNGPVSGAFRGFGVPQAAILQELIYDDLAAKCGMDRLAFRRQNALLDGQQTVCGQKLQAIGIADCLDALIPRWQAATAEIASFNEGSKTIKRGLGIASCWYGCGNTALPNPSTIRLGITARGRLLLHQGATDIGQGSNTVITQICADALGLPVDNFERVGPDTSLTPDCGKTSASRQTFVTGKAAQLAGQALRQIILRESNMGPQAILQLTEGRLLISDGNAVREIDLTVLAENANGYVLQAEETYDPPTQPLDEKGQGVPYAVYGYGAQIIEVEVDTALGTVIVKRITAAHDLGRVINPLLAEGQIEGGIAQGLGMALMEEYVPGRTENLHDYLIPTIGDVPDIQCILIEKTDPEGPMGAKGLGEHVLIPTAPAILNAIHNACGARLYLIPATPNRVLDAIRAAEAKP